MKQSIYDMNALRQSEPFFLKKKNGPDAIEMKERPATAVGAAQFETNKSSKLIREET